MDAKKKLVELANDVLQYLPWGEIQKDTAEQIADRMMDHGVTVQEWIPASEPPAQNDADKYGRVLAMEMGMMALVDYRGPINYPDRFPFWMPMPEPPEEE